MIVLLFSVPVPCHPRPDPEIAAFTKYLYCIPEYLLKRGLQLAHLRRICNIELFLQQMSRSRAQDVVVGSLEIRRVGPDVTVLFEFDLQERIDPIEFVFHYPDKLPLDMRFHNICSHNKSISCSTIRHDEEQHGA